MSCILRLSHRSEDIPSLLEISLNKSHILANRYLHEWYFLYISSILLIIPNRVGTSKVYAVEVSSPLGWPSASFGVWGYPESSHLHICVQFLLPWKDPLAFFPKPSGCLGDSRRGLCASFFSWYYWIFKAIQNPHICVNIDMHTNTHTRALTNS